MDLNVEINLQNQNSESIQEIEMGQKKILEQEFSQAACITEFGYIL